MKKSEFFYIGFWIVILVGILFWSESRENKNREQIQEIQQVFERQLELQEEIFEWVKNHN